MKINIPFTNLEVPLSKTIDQSKYDLIGYQVFYHNTNKNEFVTELKHVNLSFAIKEIWQVGKSKP